jgi:hypothetical protein
MGSYEVCCRHYDWSSLDVCRRYDQSSLDVCQCYDRSSLDVYLPMLLSVSCGKNDFSHFVAIEPYRTYLYRNKVLVITKVTTQDTPKPVLKELCHRLYRNPKLPTNTVRQSTATSQFNRSPRVAPNTFKQLVIVQKHTLTSTRIIKPPISSVREVPSRRLP